MWHIPIWHIQSMLWTECLCPPCKELTHWKRLWCWEGLGTGGEGEDRGWDGWMASLTRWTWVWVNSGSWWWTGRPGVLRLMGSQRVRHDWATELNWTDIWASSMAQWVKNLPAMQETQETWVWSLGLKDSPGEEDGNPLQYSCLENPMDRGAWWATVQRGTKSRTRLSTSTETKETWQLNVIIKWILDLPRTHTYTV